MTFIEELENMCKNAESILNRLSKLIENGVVRDDERLVVMSLLELLGAAFVNLGSAIETESDDAVQEAFDAAQILNDQAVRIIASHPSSTNLQLK